MTERPAADHARRRSGAAFLYAVPIGLLGGLIGLGGAEFRLPVLVGPLGYPARRAVPLNLAISLITIGAALAIRGSMLPFDAVVPFLPAVWALIVGAVVAAFFGTALVDRLSDERLERVILVLLVVVGLALIIEGFLPEGSSGLLPEGLAWRIPAGILFGLAIGLVSSLLGVAGGEIIIPTLVFAFGADIKVAGTASLLVSLPTVAVGVARHARRGAFADRRALTDTVAPMGVGSVLGAILGGALVGLIPAPALKVTLGLILNISAVRTFRKLSAHRPAEHRPAERAHVAPASVAAPSGARETVELVVLGLPARYPNFPELLALFARREPNIRLVVAPQQGGSGSTLARLRSEGEATRVSLVFFGRALGPRSREADLLKPTWPAGAEALRPADRDPGGHFYSCALWTPAFVYNRDRVTCPPRSYVDLLRAEGRLSYGDPTTSASGLIFIVGAILANGGSVQNPEPGFAYLRKLRQRRAAHPTSGAEALTLVREGTLSLAVHYAEASMQARHFDDAPIDVVVPSEGMPLSALAVGVTRHGPQPEAAERFLDFLLSREAQGLLAERYFRPVRTDVDIPPEVRATYPENYDAGYPFDWDSILPYQATWIERWSREIK